MQPRSIPPPAAPTPTPGPPAPRLRLPLARPRWVYVFLAINIVMFAALELTGGSTNAGNLVRFGANFAPLVAEGQVWRLVTANFLHIGILHVVVNAYALYTLGMEAEALFGHPRFIVLYLLSGVSGAIFSYMLTQGLSAGASTALFGLFGALTVFFYRQRGLLGNLGQQRLINLGMVLVVNVVIGFSPGSNIDNWGHLGGLLGGAVLGWILCPRYVLVGPRAPSPWPLDAGGSPELSNARVVDTNSLARQTPLVVAFVGGLVILTVIARLMQSR
jgi:rhomboid protease GluP